MSLKFKLSLFVIFAFFPIALLEGYQSVSRYKTQISYSETRLSEGINSQKDIFLRFFDGICRDIGFIAQITEIDKLLIGFEDKDLDEIEYWTDALATVLISFANNRQIFDELLFTNISNSKCIIRVNYAEDRAFKAENDGPSVEFNEAAAGNRPVANWIQGGDGLKLWFHYPVQNGKTTGLISAKININQLYSLCKDKEIYLVTDQGLTIINAGSSADRPGLPGRSVQLPKIGKQGIETTPDIIFSYIRFAPVRWMPDKFFSIYKIQPKSAFISPMRNSLLTQGIGIFLILMILMLCQIILLKTLVLEPLHTVSKAVHRLAELDLNVTVETNMKDEIGNLFTDINKMVFVFRKIAASVKSCGKRLADAAGRMNKNIEAIASAAKEMNSDACNVSKTAEQMSQNVAAVTGAIEDLSVSINKARNSSREHIRKEALTMAGNAGEAMVSLSEAAARIGDVTEVIKEIAFKTKLLGLNAEIEAASAGESGRGFAVVAREIRMFAHQNIRAADDIANRISVMQENSEKAITVIGDVCDEIAANALQVGTFANKIAFSIAQLAQGINEVSMSVGMAAAGKIDEPEDSSANIRRMDTSAAEVARLANELLGLVDKFRVEHEFNHLT